MAWKSMLKTGTPYLYVAAYQQLKTIAKLTLDGETRMAEVTHRCNRVTTPTAKVAIRTKIWGRNRFPTDKLCILARR